MAGDWIKMRTNIRRHPKVIAMSRYLASQNSFVLCLGASRSVTSSVTRHDSVTLDVIARVTVCGLLELWGSVNDVVKADSVIPYMCVSDIDDITGLPCFGAAMRAVGWVVEHDDDGAQGLVFPNFGEFNTPDAARKKAKSAAERAREYRERKRAEDEVEARHETSRNVTESHEMSRGEEKRREEKNIKPKTKILNNMSAAPNILSVAGSETKADSVGKIGDLAEFDVSRFDPLVSDLCWVEPLELDTPLEQIVAEFRVYHAEAGTCNTVSGWSRSLRGWVSRRVLPPKKQTA